MNQDEPLDPFDELDPAELEDLRTLLADPALWAEPSPDLEDAVVTAITSEAGRIATPVRARRRPWLLLAGGAAAAAVVVAVALVASLSGGDDRPTFEAALPAPGGTVTIEKHPGGWKIDLDVPDLPRLDNGRFYQAWMKNAEGTLVPVGSFNEGDDVVLWAGVSPEDYPQITVTIEEADGNQASSGNRVLVGDFHKVK